MSGFLQWAGRRDRVGRAQTGRALASVPAQEITEPGSFEQPRSTSGAPPRASLTIRRHCRTMTADLQQGHTNGSAQWCFLFAYLMLRRTFTTAPKVENVPK
jgi:hypothetical protein